MTRPHSVEKIRVLIDADALFAGAASPSDNSASLVILRMAEITLIDALISQQALAEAERNLQAKLPRALPAFKLLVQRCLRVVPDPSHDEISAHDGIAHAKDLPILVCALRENCRWLVTFNINDYGPGHPDVTVLKPGDFVHEVRYQLARMDR